MTGFDPIGFLQAGEKTLTNKNAEKEQICHWVGKRWRKKKISISWRSHLKTPTHTHDMNNKSHLQALLKGVRSLLRLYHFTKGC